MLVSMSVSLDPILKSYPNYSLPIEEFRRRQTGFFLALAQSAKQRTKKVAEACIILSSVIENEPCGSEMAYAVQTAIDKLINTLPKPL